jgi:putative sporulation protein YtxC
MTIVYNDEIQDISNDIVEIKQCFDSKNIVIGIVESLINKNHIIKIFCEDEYYTEKTVNIFNIYLANVLYKIVIGEFYKNEIEYFLNETYFFLKEEELIEIRSKCFDAMESEGKISDESTVYCLNRRNNIIQKIILCLEQNKEINVNGFVRFRMKELVNELEGMVDKIVEKYMAEKEYTEFIKLLKYFVDIQESKLDVINIIIEKDGNYIVKDSEGESVLDQLLNELYDTKYSDAVSMEDIIISGLITNSPRSVIIHGLENCLNTEFIETIKNVFCDRVKICDTCKTCETIKHSLKV